MKGFTLIEIIVVVAILALILAMAMLAHIDLFKGDIFRSEEYTIISLLERARSQSMANINDTTHGVCFSAGKYILFEGATCTPGGQFDANANIATISNFSSSFPTIIFNRLTGNTTSCPIPPTPCIHITDNIKSADISINNEGAIIW